MRGNYTQAAPCIKEMLPHEMTTFFHSHSAEEASAGVSFTTDLSNIGSGLLAKKSDFGQFSREEDAEIS